MIREEEPMEDFKTNLKRKNENNDDDDIKQKNFIFDDDIFNIQLVGDEININKSDEDIKIQPSHPRDRYARHELSLTKIQPPVQETEWLEDLRYQ